MPNRAINQFPNAASLQDGDLLYAVRGTTDYKIDAATFAGRIQSFQTVIASADVLTIGTTPVIVVPAPSASQVLLPVMVYFQYINGSTGYVSTGDLSVFDVGLNNVYAYSQAMGFTGDGNVMQIVGAPLTAGAGLFLTTSDFADPGSGDFDLKIIVYYTVHNG
jgi:hypothetical protein